MNIEWLFRPDFIAF